MEQWYSCQYNQVDHIEKVFHFKKYAIAVAFANMVAGIAELHIHHPRLTIEWGKTTVAWGTHKSDEGSGVLAIDKILAKKTDELYACLTIK
ncbi:MAG: 4a-hydroxytetrahydrobiopterin dehydratase [Endozoicomonas sp. (ex Botrylloides leachii)]|nr:4a-hydroxytetrahydrobiopterin dehydratase [Endozoicomonas sp. (ex Botrylloides leachii)]